MNFKNFAKAIVSNFETMKDKKLFKELKDVGKQNI